MTCDEIRERGPLYLSGELIGAERARFAAHLAACAACELEIEAHALVDARISAALCSEIPDASHIQARVRRQVARRRWIPAGAIAAGLLAAAGTYGLLRPAPAPDWYAAAARDHRDEVTEGQPRRWRTDPAEIETVAAQGGLSLMQSQALAAPGYVLERARRCGISGEPMVHLVFSNGTRRYSVFVSPHPGVKTKVRQLHSGSEEVAGFETGRLRAAIVTAGAAPECEELARLAASRL
jgi:anti-sigma factor RsiW